MCAVSSKLSLSNLENREHIWGCLRFRIRFGQQAFCRIFMIQFYTGSSNLYSFPLPV
ncbi:hypothetical protein [Methanosarcina mazei]|uniref:hypothetical protein n=1 Tax=Methanosarcina mazei TaxID=2209 RepID=UPI000A675079|nr:hypothetical protein [Methanosarcina mazei]